MKYLILLLNVLSFWLMADVAHAEPITLAIAAIGEFLGSISIGKLVLTVALNIGLSLIERAMAKKDQQPAGTKLEISMGDDHPMSFIIGSYATAGRRKYAGTWGEDGKTPNAYFTDVIEIGSLPNRAGERGLSSLWIDDRKVGVLWEEPHPDGRGFPVIEYRVKGKDYLWVKFLDGTQEAPDPFLMAKFGSLGDRQWRQSMVGRGCQIAILTSRYNRDLFSGVPSGLFEPHPLPLYDIRKDSSMGGNGAHRWNDRSTWERSTNPAVMIYNLVRGVYYGPEWVYGGQNIGAFCLPAANWMAAANACDAAVGLGDGNSEPAFRAGYDVQCDREPLDVISELLKGCNGRMAEVGGVFKMLVGAPGGAVYSFTDDDIVVTEAQDFEPFPSLSATFNAIEATYPEPAEKWATKDAPGRYNADLEAQDGYRRLPAQVQLLAVPFANQVQRVAVAMIQDYRRFRVHQVSLPPDAYPLEPNDVVSWSSARNGYDEKKFLVVKVEPQPNFLIVVTLKEIDPADYDWHPGLQLPTSIGWLGPITPPSQPMVGWTVEPSTIKDAGGIDRRPAIKISCAPDLDDVVGVWVQVRVKASGDMVFDSDSNPYATPYSWVLSGQWTLPNADYEARGRYLPQSNRPTDWSAWLTLKTPNVLINAADIFDGAIIQSKIADAAVTAAKIMDEAVTSLKLADKAVSAAKIEVAAVTADVLASNAVIASKLADGAVTARALAQGAVDATAFASGLKAVEVVNALPTAGNTEGRQVFLTTDGKLYRYHNGAWTAAVAAGDVNGTLSNAQIADGVITANKLAALAVDASKLADGSVSATKLAQGAVDLTKFASNLSPIQIVTTFSIVTDPTPGMVVYHRGLQKLFRYTPTGWTSVVPSTDLTGQITSTQISDGAISTPKLMAGAVTTDIIAANAITADKIAANAIITGAISAGAVKAEQIAANNITAKHLVLADMSNMADNGWQAGNLDGWEVAGFYAYAYSAGEGDASGYYARSTAQWSQFLSRMIAVNPGEQYFLDVWVQNNASPEGASIWLFGYDANNANVYNSYIDGVTSVQNKWARLKGQATVPAGVVKVRMGLYNAHAGVLAVPGIAWSKPVMRRASGVELIVDGAITAAKVAANAITADKIAANAILAKNIVVQDWSNMVPNGKWEDTSSPPTDYFTATGGFMSWLVDPANAVEGKSYLRLSKPALGQPADCVQKTFSPIGGSTPLQWVVYFKVEGDTQATPAGVFIRILWYDANQNQLTLVEGAGYTDLVGNSNTTPGWNNRSGKITSPANARFFRMQYINWVNSGAQNLDIASMVIRRANAASLIVDGSISANMIAVSAVTAGKIAADAVTAGTIAAGAITADKLAAGSVSAKALAVGNGGNLLTNTDLLAGLTGWAYEWSNEPASFRVKLRTDTFAPAPGAIEIYQINGTQNIEYGVGSVDAYGNMQFISVKANAWYELSVYYLGHRCKGVRPYLGVYDGAGNWLAWVQWGDGPAYQNIDPLKSLSKFDRFWGKYQMPANAATVRVFFRSMGTVAGQGDSYLWLTRMYFGEANANQTEPTPWSDGGLTLISGGNIVSNAVTADKIAANAITAGKIAAGAVTAGTIAAGAVTASTIAGGSITGDKIAANTIGVNQIAAGAITAKSLVLTDFSNMVDNGWQGGNLDGWTIQNLQAFYLDTTSGDAAGYVMQSLGRDCATSKYIQVTAGETYAFDVWVYNVDAGQANIYAALLTPSGGWAGFAVVSTTSKNGWVRLQGRYTIPSGYVKLAMLLQVDKTAGTGNSCYWSKPVMRRATSGELIVDGAITGNKIAANAITAAQIATGAITTEKLILNGVTVDKIAPGAVTAMNAGRVADLQVIGSGSTINLAAVGISVDGDSRVMINAMSLGQYGQNNSSTGAQAIGCNIFRNGLAIFSQTYYLGVVQTVVTLSGGGSPNGTGQTANQATYTAGLVGLPALYDAPGPGYHVYTFQIYVPPGNNVGWRETNIVATAFKR
ncbi:phage tail protein [Rhizobium lusitanum]|uniref:Tip attachment protein J domain-containing protein n=1 Tax=Rhizobium lusitanum TaxID=293958 RepID=A0A7X0IPP1_9HYPH|nr:phage tail protein [Rhizobium lusitanum]MBB6484875.1 hypothetical protein [Rhizobium lusitanum]